MLFVAEKCQLIRNVRSSLRSSLLYLLIEVPSYHSVWQLLLTSDVFLKVNLLSKDCYRHKRSVRVKWNAGFYTDLFLPAAMTDLVIHNVLPSSCGYTVYIFSGVHNQTGSWPNKVASLKLQKSTQVFKYDDWLWNIRYYISICSIAALIVEVKIPADVCACLQICLCIYIFGWSQSVHIFACLSVWL